MFQSRLNRIKPQFEGKKKCLKGAVRNFFRRKRIFLGGKGCFSMSEDLLQHKMVIFGVKGSFSEQNGLVWCKRAFFGVKGPFLSYKGPFQRKMIFFKSPPQKKFHHALCWICPPFLQVLYYPLWFCSWSVKLIIINKFELC